jgi:hypothetical protein
MKILKIFHIEVVDFYWNFKKKPIPFHKNFTKHLLTQQEQRKSGYCSDPTEHVHIRGL